jgi:hypothetical protein
VSDLLFVLPGRESRAGLIKKKLGRYVAICDVCNDPGPGAETFAGAVAAKKAAGWESRRYRRDGAWYDICRACLEEQAELRTEGKKNLFDFL